MKCGRLGVVAICVHQPVCMSLMCVCACTPILEYYDVDDGCLRLPSQNPMSCSVKCMTMTLPPVLVILNVGTMMIMMIMTAEARVAEIISGIGTMYVILWY